MMTQYPDLFAALAAPFADVKQRSGGGGRQLSYITARQAAIRLDDVLGPENWQDEYHEVGDVLFCRLTITLPDGRSVTKSDAGGYKEMTMRDKGQEVVDEENTDKTGASDAFKRAAAKFGVARYLYNDGVPAFVKAAQGAAPARPAPDVRSQATPATPPRPAAPAKAPTSERPISPPVLLSLPTEGYDGRHGDLPRSVKGIYPWCLEQEKKYRDLDLKKALSAYGQKTFGKDKWKTQTWTESEMAQAMVECAIPLLDEVAPANPQ